jgi:hypothetical protein
MGGLIGHEQLWIVARCGLFSAGRRQVRIEIGIYKPPFGCVDEERQSQPEIQKREIRPAIRHSRVYTRWTTAEHSLSWTVLPVPEAGCPV